MDSWESRIIVGLLQQAIQKENAFKDDALNGFERHECADDIAYNCNKMIDYYEKIIEKLDIN